MSSKYQPGTRVSEYVLDEPLGVGSFGEVWRAHHHIWNDAVAIKLPTEPEYVRYLRTEGIVVHGLRHPNIVGVKGLDPYADIPYLVMELVDGPSLRQVLEEHPDGLPIGLIQPILTGILRAMVVAHEAHVLHRDLKPGNILLDLEGKLLEDITADSVKVSDFGLGSGTTDALRSIAQSASLDRGDKLVGTLAYMAPELRDGGAQADERSDLYSIGVILFEMITGDRPAGTELPSAIRQISPPIYDAIFQRLYARHDRRYASARDVLDDLTAADRPPAPPVPPPATASATLPPIPGATPTQRCPKCGSQVEPYDQFCTQCAHQLVENVRKCPGCGAFPGPSDKYCIFCGQKLGTA